MCQIAPAGPIETSSSHRGSAAAGFAYHGVQKQNMCRYTSGGELCMDMMHPPGAAVTVNATGYFSISGGEGWTGHLVAGLGADGINFGSAHAAV